MMICTGCERKLSSISLEFGINTLGSKAADDYFITKYISVYIFIRLD